jgi:hypothetical protein
MAINKGKKFRSLFRHFFDKHRIALLCHYYYAGGKICKSYYNTDTW